MFDSYYKILKVFTIIYKGKQKIGFEIEKFNKPIFVFPKYLQQLTGVHINEVEILTNSYFHPIFFEPGETMYSGKIFESGESKILKTFSILTSGSIDEMRAKNFKLIKNFQEIKKAFHFNKYGVSKIGFDIGYEKAVFVTAKWVKRLTTLDVEDIHILKGSFLLPEYYNKGENIYEKFDRPPELCRYSGVILKNLQIRFSDNINEMDKKYKIEAINSVFTYSEKNDNENDFEYNDRNSDYSENIYDSSKWLEDAAGTNDPEIMNDVYWNLD